MRRLLGAIVVGLALVTTGTVCHAQTVRRSLTIGIRISESPAFADSTPVHSLTPRDTFLGPDKLKHFLLSGFIESTGFSGMQAIGAGRPVSIGTATAVTAAVGLARELHDGRTKGLFSLGDLTWDALGTGAALLLISHSQR